MFPINRQNPQHIDEVARIAVVAVQVAVEAAVQDHVRHDLAVMAAVVHVHIHDDLTHVRDLGLVHSAVQIIVDVGVAQTIVRAAIITEWVNSIDQITSEISKIVVEIVGIVAAMVGAIVAAMEVAIVISVTIVVSDVSIGDRLHTAQNGDEVPIVVHHLHRHQMRSHHRHQKKIHSQDLAVNRASKKSNACWTKPRKKNKKK